MPYVRRLDRNMELLWLLGLLKIPAALFIITYSYFRCWTGLVISYLDTNPLDQYDFIVGKVN